MILHLSPRSGRMVTIEDIDCHPFDLAMVIQVLGEREAGWSCDEAANGCRLATESVSTVLDR